MKVIIWSKDNCKFCDMAKNLLSMKKIEYEENKIGYNYTREDLLKVVPNARSVPQIFVDDKLIGGYEELKRFLN